MAVYQIDKGKVAQKVQQFWKSGKTPKTLTQTFPFSSWSQLLASNSKRPFNVLSAVFQKSVRWEYYPEESTVNSVWKAAWKRPCGRKMLDATVWDIFTSNLIHRILPTPRHFPPHLMAHHHLFFLLLWEAEYRFHLGSVSPKLQNGSSCWPWIFTKVLEIHLIKCWRPTCSDA